MSNAIFNKQDYQGNKEQYSNVVIFASSHTNGNTRGAVEFIFQGISHEFIDLSSFKISPYDYNHENREDAFLPLIEKIVCFDNIILASPVYWYAVSAQMKIFLDRWSDLLKIRKDLGSKLAAKNLFAICSYATDFPLGCSAFEVPIRLMCDYMNMNYGGCFYHFSENKLLGENPEIVEFRNRIIKPNFLEQKIRGDKIFLRMASLEDRKKLFEWMYCSDASKSMWGSPLFPEKSIKTWDEFKNSWDLFYYTKPLTSRGHVFVIEHNGEDVGGIAFHRPDNKNRSEIDIWLRSENDCGKGIGTDAINVLCKYLYREFGIMFFWVMPSLRNPRSIATFQKIGFKQLPFSPMEGKHEFGFQDYEDSVYLLKDMSLENLASSLYLGNAFPKDQGGAV